MEYINPGVLFTRRFGAPASVDDVMEYVRFLREETGMTIEPPVDLALIYERFGVPIPKRAALTDLQGLLANPERGIILINSADLPSRQRFTEGHELMELLFSALSQGSSGASRRSGVFKQSAKERLCNEGSAELLMPRSSLVPRVCRVGVSYQTAQRIASEYGVSMTAALVQMVRVGPGRHAVVLWRMKNKPSEIRNTPGVNQLQLFEELPQQAFSKKLRVEWVLSGRAAPYVPAHKSIPTDSSVYAAWRDGVFTVGEDYLDLSTVRGHFRSESQPFEIEGDRQVLSLLHLPGDEEPLSVQYRFAKEDEE